MDKSQGKPVTQRWCFRSEHKDKHLGEELQIRTQDRSKGKHGPWLFHILLKKVRFLYYSNWFWILIEHYLLQSALIFDPFPLTQLELVSLSPSALLCFIYNSIREPHVGPLPKKSLVNCLWLGCVLLANTTPLSCIHAIESDRELPLLSRCAHGSPPF